MNELKITNQLLKQFRDEVEITSNVRELLIEEGGESLIKVSDIKKLFVECGGSPFDYLLTYNNGRYGREGWETSDSPENFYSHYDDDKSIERLDESDLSEKMIKYIITHLAIRIVLILNHVLILKIFMFLQILKNYTMHLNS